MAGGIEIEVETRAAEHEHKKSNKKQCFTGSCCQICSKISYLIVATITIIVCVILLVLVVGSAIISRSYSTQEQGRVAAMIVLAVTSGITIACLICAFVAVCRNKVKPLHVTAIVLIIVAVIQMVVAGTSVKVTAYDEESITRSLVDSFRLARSHNPRHQRLWATTQHDLKCCGVYSPDDYRTPGTASSIVPPDVHVSCCSTFDPHKSEILQEVARQKCRTSREYRINGCRYRVVELFQTTAHYVLSLLILVIVLEIFTAIYSLCIGRQVKKAAKTENDNSGHT